MRYIKYVVFTFICMIFVPLVSHADCDYQREAELSRIASNVQINYTYEITRGYPTFTVNITNVTNDIYIEDNFEHSFSGQTEFKQDYRLGQNSVEYTIRSNDNNCKGYSITTKYVNFPYYNQFSSLPECQNSDLEMCSLWYNSSSYTQDEFLEDLEKAKSNKKEVPSEKKEKEGALDVLKDMLSNKMVIVFGVVVLIAVIILAIYFVLKKVRKR